VLETIAARQDPDDPFGDKDAGSDGEQYWIEREPTPEDIVARESWKPDPAIPLRSTTYSSPRTEQSSSCSEGAGLARR
jgi:hypothetical protein